MRTPGLGLPGDSREYGTGAQILADLGITSMRLLTEQSSETRRTVGFGLEISGGVPLEIGQSPQRLLPRTKRTRMGHELGGRDER